MSLLPIPRGVYPSITDIDPKALAGKGVRLVLADLDNTMAAYKVLQPPAEAFAWKDALEAQGIRLFLLSNSRKPGRARAFAEKLGVPYQGHSGKPGKKGYLRAMERMGARPEETVMVGDQIFTDTLGANNAGVTPLLVEPIRLAGNPFRYVRYAIETPFRLLGKRRPFL
ncbi:MAG: YqeG family HAD IIIA-type phosphatase [Lawsonibacter sp.]|nr:YqeG family HAD IIIA-type phosphatase [Lawsonibacter sp.]